MLKTIKINPSVANLIFIGKNNTINEVDTNSKVVEVKIIAKIAKSKSKNLVKPFLAKF